MYYYRFRHHILTNDSSLFVSLWRQWWIFANCSRIIRLELVQSCSSIDEFPRPIGIYSRSFGLKKWDERFEIYRFQPCSILLLILTKRKVVTHCRLPIIRHKNKRASSVFTSYNSIWTHSDQLSFALVLVRALMWIGILRSDTNR